MVTHDKTTGKEVNALTAAREKSRQPQNVSRETSSEISVAYINRVEFSGRLGREPKHRFTPSGKELVNSSLAVLNPGNDEQSTMWFDLTLWVNDGDDGKAPSNLDLVEAFLNMEKGRKVVAHGRLAFHSFVDKQGDSHMVYTITLTDIG